MNGPFVGEKTKQERKKLVSGKQHRKYYNRTDAHENMKTTTSVEVVCIVLFFLKLLMF